MSIRLRGWCFRVIDRKPWQAVTVTGERVRFTITPPSGLIIAEASIAADGTLTILTVDDVPRDLVRVEDAAEAARFHLECQRDLKGEDE